MAHSFYIEASDDTLRELGEKFVPVEEDRFQYCLQNKKFSIEDIHKFQSNLRISYDYVCREYERMKELRLFYNLDYPNDHKKYFSTMVELMGKMRSTLHAYKKILNDLRPRNTKKGSISHDPTSLHNGPYSRSMFGWDVYQDKAVIDLYNDINGFLKLAGEIYKEAMAIIEEEKDIRSDPEQAYPRYERSFQQSVKRNKKLIELIRNGNENVDNDIVRALDTAEDVRVLIASLFHEISFDDFNYFCACKIISDERKNEMTREKAAALGISRESAMKLTVLIDNIEELVKQREDAIGWKGMLDGEFVMHLLYWCGWNGCKNDGLLKYITKRCEGKIRVVKMGAVMAEKRKLLRIDNSVIRAQQDHFNKQMDDFVDSILAKQAQERA